MSRPDLQAHGRALTRLDRHAEQFLIELQRALTDALLGIVGRTSAVQQRAGAWPLEGLIVPGRQTYRQTN